MDYELMKNLALIGMVIACTRLWFYAFAHYKYVMVRRVALGKKILANQLTIEQIINKTKQEVREEDEIR